MPWVGKNMDRVSRLRKLLQETEARRVVLQFAVERLLLSADATWEEKNLGHDWRFACEDARRALEAEADA